MSLRPSLPAPLALTVLLTLAVARSPALAQQKPRGTPSTPSAAPSTPVAPSTPATPSTVTPPTPSGTPTTPSVYDEAENAEADRKNANNKLYSDLDKEIAAKKYGEGARLAKQQLWQEAYPHFLGAWKHFKHWQIAVSLGRVELEVGKFHAAEQHLSFALGAADLPAGDRVEVARLIGRAQGEQGVIRIVGTAQGPARVWVDEELVGTTPFTGTTSADPGEHRVELRFGTERRTEVVTVRKGETRTVTLDLQVAGLNTPVPPTEGAAPVPEGTRWAAVIGLGVASVTAISVGAGLWTVSDAKGTEARKKFDALPALPSGACRTSSCVAVHNTYVEQASFQAAAGVLFGAAVLGAAGAVIVGLWPGSAQAGSAPRVSAGIGPGAASLLVQGSW